MDALRRALRAITRGLRALFGKSSPPAPGTSGFEEFFGS